MAINMVCLGGAGLGYVVYCAATNGKRLVRRVRAQWRDVLLINISTFLSSASPLVAYRWIEPAAVKVVFCSSAPLFVLLLSGWLGQGTARARGKQYLAACGTALSLAILLFALLSGRSGMTPPAGSGLWIALLASVACGLGLSLNIIVIKRLEVAGWEIPETLAARFFGVVAGGLPLLGVFGGRALSQSDLPALAALSILSVVLPLWVFQVGLKKSSPLGASLIYASAPAMTQLFQQLDSRLAVSPVIWAAVALNVVSSALALLR
jgi:hypothetical protein